MQQIHHKKNELFEDECYKDKECTEAFDFTGKMHLYLQADITVLLELLATHQIEPDAEIFVPRLSSSWYELSLQDSISNKVQTLDDITPNLSKYIPEDNAVLFLSEQDMEKYKDCFPSNHIGLYINDGKNDETFIANNTESLINGIVEVKKGNATIFLQHGTKSELQKANEVGKHLWENFRIKPNVCALHWFGSKYQENGFEIEYLCESFGILSNINKIITTTSTGILKHQNRERLQVIDCKEIFEN